MMFIIITIFIIVIGDLCALLGAVDHCRGARGINCDAILRIFRVSLYTISASPQV